MKASKGFSLIELLIVVAIILIIAALSIPNLLRSRISAHEASAVASIRTINTAQVAYSVAYPDQGYADDLSKLKTPPAGTPPDLNSAGLLDPVLGCGSQPCSKSGYDFSVVNPSGSPVISYDLTDVPSTVGISGIRGFCSSQLATVSYDPNGGTSCSTLIP
jgi:prepilin-type N-terminal cleavage/methylation domain-containing protein